ncbi:MAG: alpha/beta hydrolase [Ktedonobacteraceae bacterium]
MQNNTQGSANFTHHYIPPAQAGQHGPTLLLLHGTGGDENDLLDLGRMLAPGAALLSPRGKVLEHGMPRFFRRLAEGVFDVPDLIQRTHELADFVESASTTYGFDATGVIAVGFSNGANIAASMLLLRPQVLAAAVLLHPMVPFVPEKLPHLTGKNVFIGAGRRDPMIPMQNTEQLVKLLQDTGASVEAHWHNGGHTITHEEVRDARQWMQSFLHEK